MKRFAMILFVLATGLSMAATANAADKCKHETCWGAVGFGADKKHGYSFWYSSENGARDRVNQECPTCKVVQTFANGCGALYEGKGGNWGFAKGANKGEASSGAKAICESKGGQDCKRRVWACSRK